MPDNNCDVTLITRGRPERHVCLVGGGAPLLAGRAFDSQPASQKGDAGSCPFALLTAGVGRLMVGVEAPTMAECPPPGSRVHVRMHARTHGTSNGSMTATCRQLESAVLPADVAPDCPSRQPGLVPTSS